MEHVTKAPYHLHLPRNTRGRDFYMGDAHGRLDAVLLALDAAGFNPQTDRLISVGDLVDRGPNSYELLKLTRQPWFYSVRGNHEAMLIGTECGFSLVHWQSNGGKWFLELDGESALDSHALAISLPVAITVDIGEGRHIGVCHAEWTGPDWTRVEPAMADKKQVESMLWGRTVLRQNIHREDASAALTIHGHTPIDEPKRLGSALFIDTGCVYGGKLTLLSTEEALNWQPEPL